MNKQGNKFKLTGIAVALALVIPQGVRADQTYDALKSQVDILTSELKKVQESLKQYQHKAASKQDVAELKQEVKSVKEVKGSSLQTPNTLIHMSGYADVGYSNKENGDGSFNVGSFSPIFHFQYRDLVMLEAELELELEDDGETKTALEYLTADVFLNDNVTLVAGKFLSPIGQFRQNLHPSWINKLPSAPPGFGHDGAAPVSDVGIQLRGGFPLGSVRTNYAVYAGNGPELNSATEDGTDFELEGVRAEGFGADSDGNKVFGGRLGIIPIPRFEIGASFLTGKAAVNNIENESLGTIESVSGETDRDYDVFGVDFAWQKKDLNIRGEYVKTKVGSANTGLTASPGEDWKTWYAQAAYRIQPTKFEGVLRYTDFTAPLASTSQEQIAVGANYLFTNNFIGKVAYEFNDSQSGSLSDDDRLLFQLAYGF